MIPEISELLERARLSQKAAANLLRDGFLRNPVKSHTIPGVWRTVGREKTLVKDIVHHVCGMVRFPRNFL
jgi:hypothetical protein